MNNLTELYKQIKSFADSHNMVNEFHLINSESDINSLNMGYRSMIILPLEANLSRELNNPTYTLDFGVIILDKVVSGDSLAHMISNEENIFIIGQLQDFLLQSDRDVSFENVELSSGQGDDYNISVATTDFSVTLARSPYIKSIDNE